MFFTIGDLEKKVYVFFLAWAPEIVLMFLVGFGDFAKTVISYFLVYSFFLVRTKKNGSFVKPAR